MADIVRRVMVILHRYLAIAVGLQMVMWFVSGIVMTCPTRASSSEAPGYSVAGSSGCAAA
jgi:uncharacterized iron-regulated membrane protein